MNKQKGDKMGLEGHENKKSSQKIIGLQDGDLEKKYKERFDRIQRAIGSKSDSKIAKALGIKQPSVTGARKRKQIPYSWIIKIAEDQGVSADWLLFGEGVPYRNTNESHQIALIEESQQGIAQTVAKLISTSEFLSHFIDKKENNLCLTEEEKNKLRDYIEKDKWKELKDVIMETATLLLKLLPAMREK